MPRQSRKTMVQTLPNHGQIRNRNRQQMPITKTEFMGLMVRCNKHNDFFNAGDAERNAIWYAKLPKNLTLNDYEQIIDNHFASSNRQIMLADFVEASKNITRQQKYEQAKTVTGFMGLPFPTDISDANLERLRLLKSGKRFPLSEEWPLSPWEQVLQEMESKNAGKQRQ